MSDSLNASGRVALPMPNCDRWTAARKHSVVLAIDLGYLTEREALERYGVSFQELGEWRRGRLFASREDRNVIRLDGFRRTVLP